jgi:hypothetical protein
MGEKWNTLSSVDKQARSHVCVYTDLTPPPLRAYPLHYKLEAIAVIAKSSLSTPGFKIHSTIYQLYKSIGILHIASLSLFICKAENTYPVSFWWW